MKFKAVLTLSLIMFLFFFNWRKDKKTDKIKLQAGFKVEHIYSPSDHNMGSWVAMTFDHKERLIVSDQFGALYRLTLKENESPDVEKLHIEGDTIGVGTAHGLLYAFDGLYVVVNNWPNDNFPRKSGFYKLEDSDGNDQYDKIILLKELNGEGEHGPHSIILSPDKKSLYLIAGNHTDLPEIDSYRLPNTWQHDNLYPFIKDPRGHAVDRKEPGGWIAKIDPENNHWELVSAGYRNPFDIAFNEAGDLFTYDADMEWDFGLPWYRPTRINHVTSGSEYGWRTGSAKWPDSFTDNLPAILNIGPGSPTNLVSLKDAAFPEKYQNTLLAFDWSFGIIHAIFLEPDGSTYTAKREEFLSGIPLPLTDGVIGPDGALYFMTGGRRLGSDLYKVTYTGKDVKKNKTIAVNEDNSLRRKLEGLHTVSSPDQLDFIWENLDHPDRFVAYAARIALEQQPVTDWKEKAFLETNPKKAIQALIALIRTDSSDPEIMSVLNKLDFEALEQSDRLALLRAYELYFSRAGEPSIGDKTKFLFNYTTLFPLENDEENRQLAKLLVFLKDPTIVSKVLNYLDEDLGHPERAGGTMVMNEEDLILRNPDYGLDLAKMLEKLPPLRQTYYRILLSESRSGWTNALRDRYYDWFKEGFKYQGGLSYIGFLDRARKTALENVPSKLKEHYDELSGKDLLSESGNSLEDVTFPKGPGRSWKLEEAAGVFDGELANRNFERGRNMYRAALCDRCHTMRGEGVSLGPDLTQLGTRFSVRDILEAIIDPNASISDQYAFTQFQTKSGETIVGKIVNEDEKKVYIFQNPFTPDITVEINKTDIVSRTFSPVSMMLPGLINSMSEEEVKDLVAFLVAGGNPDHQAFKK